MLLTANGITKSFDSTKALSDVSARFDVGRVHALVGENGAGKSTLFKILAGYVPMDSGEVILRGSRVYPVKMLRAKDTRIVLVHQELNVNLSVGIAENIFSDRLRSYANLFGIIDSRRLLEDAQSVLDSLDAKIDPRTPISSLDLGQLKIVQVAQALSKEPEVLFLDESTAYLNAAEVQNLVRVVRNLKEKGLAIGFVSHHLEEIEMVADDITILKDGRTVGSYPMGELSIEQIETLMVGRKKEISFPKSERARGGGAVVFSARGLSLGNRLDGVGFDLARGEVLGLAGLKGAGGEALMELMVGDVRPASGSMTVKGAPYAPRSPHDAFLSGLSYLPASRQTEGLIPEFSIKENIIMTKYPRSGAFVDNKAAMDKVNSAIGFFDIKTGGMDLACTSLSGGNMQKVAIAKSVNLEPEILLLNNPTRGIDISARFDIYAKVRELVEKRGLTVVILSEDLVELLGLSDRILVFRKGKVSKEFSRADAPTENDVITHMI